jgi:hypothetical protein
MKDIYHKNFRQNIEIVPESAWQWNGNVDLYPNYDYFQDETVVPNVNVDIDLSTPWEQFAESPFGTIFGDWRNVSSTSTTNQGGSTITTITQTVQEQIINELQVNTLTENYRLGCICKRCISKSLYENKSCCILGKWYETKE